MWSKALCLSVALLASVPATVMIGQEPQELPLFSSQSDLVVVHATVKDRRGAYVAGLGREAFNILEDGRPQNPQFFTSADAPVTVGLLFDSSGSMVPNRDRVIAAAAAFAQASHPSDELFALAFNDSVRAVLPRASPFTSDVTVLQEALAKAIHANGRTALFDAVAAGLEYLDRGRHARRVLVIVSDGGDNVSRIPAEEIMAKTRASNAVIYTVALVDPVGREVNPRLLERIAKATGGEAFAPRKIDDITEVLRRIARDIRHTYTLGYVSTNSARDGGFRQIRLVVQSPTHRRLVVRTRSGYLARPARAGSEDDAR